MTFPFQLISLLLIANVTFRVLTNELHVLPKIFNVIDLPIVGLLFFLSFAHRGTAPIPAWASRIQLRLVLFGILALIGTLLNLSFVHPIAAASQAIMLFTPLLLFLAVIQFPLTASNVDSYTKLLRRLIVLELVIGVLQIPSRFASNDSEAVHGTFPGNAEQYAAFLMIALCYLIARASLVPQKKGIYGVLIVLVLVLNVSIDNKASWFGTVVALGVVLAVLFNMRAAIIRWFVAFGALGILVLLVAFFAQKTSGTLYKFTVLAEALRSGNALSLGKVKAYVDIARSHTQSPEMLMFGSGLSTFYSRGCRQFYLSQRARERMYKNPDMLDRRETTSRGSDRASDSMGGAISIALFEPYYSQFYGPTHQIYAIGSSQVDTPYAPYAGLFGETGVVGALLYLSIYVAAFRWLTSLIPLYRYDERIFPFLAITLGFFVYMAANSIYGPFLETTRLTTLLWSFLGLIVVYVREDQMRRMAGDNEVTGEATDIEVTAEVHR